MERITLVSKCKKIRKLGAQNSWDDLKDWAQSLKCAHVSSLRIQNLGRRQKRWGNCNQKKTDTENQKKFDTFQFKMEWKLDLKWLTCKIIVIKGFKAAQLLQDKLLLVKVHEWNFRLCPNCFSILNFIKRVTKENTYFFFFSLLVTFFLLFLCNENNAKIIAHETFFQWIFIYVVFRDNL